MLDEAAQHDEADDRPARRLPGRAQCKWPMWGHRDRATHVHCCRRVQEAGAPGMGGRYCREHVVVARRPGLLVVEAPAAQPKPQSTPQPAPQPQAVVVAAARGARQRLDADAALAMRERGATVPLIAERLGCARSTVTRLLDRRGMPQGRGALLAMGASADG